MRPAVRESFLCGPRWSAPGGCFPSQLALLPARPRRRNRTGRPAVGRRKADRLRLAVGPDGHFSLGQHAPACPFGAARPGPSALRNRLAVSLHSKLTTSSTKTTSSTSKSQSFRSRHRADRCPGRRGTAARRVRRACWRPRRPASGPSVLIPSVKHDQRGGGRPSQFIQHARARPSPSGCSRRSGWSMRSSLERCPGCPSCRLARTPVRKYNRSL